MSERRTDWVLLASAFIATGLIAMVLAEARVFGYREEIAFGLPFAAFFGAVAFARWRRGSAPLRPQPETVIAELEQRVAELEATQDRLAELEERVEFAERLLAQGSAEGSRLPVDRGRHG